jgi:hypothetical protein
MNLYLISQNVNYSYDTYDSAVVQAESEEEARKIYPGSKNGLADDCLTYDWANPKNVKVELIGSAAPGIKDIVICASFNAG